MSDSSRAVFLSYASQDAEAVRRIAEALRAAGVEVWFDQNELVGGDAWDAKIRKQIATCALFVPVISTATQARAEGYFRREWKLAVERTHDMADHVAFLLPVVLDDTKDRGAHVPEAFLKVQWTRLRSASFGGQALHEPILEAFCARVKKLLDGAEMEAGRPRPAERDAGVASPAPASARPATINRRTPRWIWPAGIAALIALVTTIALTRSPTPTNPKPTQPSVASAKEGTQNSKPTPAEAAADIAVAVLPFSNVGGDPANEYFSDGLTEEILNVLAREHDLRVAARTSAFSFKGRNVPLAEIGRALGVSRVVEGSVRRAGNRVRITVQLTRVADGFSEALGSFDKELTDVFALQDEVARAVLHKLVRRTATVAGPVIHTKNPEAYDAYLRGRALQSRSSRDAPAAIIEFERAVALDPAFALAWARLGEAHFRSYANGIDRTPEVLSAARTAIDHALATQPDLPEALVMRVTLLQQTGGEEAEIERVSAKIAELRPDSLESHTVERLRAIRRGESAAARRLTLEMIALDPENGDRLNGAGLLIARGGDASTADQLYARAVVIHGQWDWVPWHNRLRLWLRWRGPAATLALLEASRNPDDDFCRAWLLFLVGREKEARVLAESAAWAVMPTEGPTSFRSVKRMLVLSDLGVTDSALRMARAVQADAQAQVARGNRGRYVLHALVMAEITLGHRETALRLLADWKKDALASPLPEERADNFYDFAILCYARLGVVNEVAASVREMRGAGLRLNFCSLVHEADFRGMRGDPRFIELMQEEAAWAAAQPGPTAP